MTRVIAVLALMAACGFPLGLIAATPAQAPQAPDAGTSVATPPPDPVPPDGVFLCTRVDGRVSCVAFPDHVLRL